MKTECFILKNQITCFQFILIFLLLILPFGMTITGQGWEQLNDSPFIDDHTNSFGHEGKAYVFRGIPRDNGNGAANEIWMYTPETDSWEMIMEFPGEARRISIGDDWNGKYYYGFGIGGPDELLNDLWEFDPSDMSFTQLPSCPCIGRTHPSLIAHDDKIFMGAGSSFGGDLKDWWEYDMITQEWSQKPDIPGAIRHHTFHFSSEKYVYVGGGHVSNWNRYDPETAEWTPIDDLPQGRVAGTQFNYAGLGFILAGDDRFHVHVPDFETFMFFDPSTGEWDYLPPLPNGSRWAPSSFLIDNNLYFMAGLSDVISGDATMWKFDMSNIGCLPPNDLKAVNVDDVSAGLLWSSNSNGISDTLLWRKVGDADWNRVVDPEAVYQLENLEACQEYEFQVIKECESNTVESEIHTFTTDGCCVNPEITVNSITEKTALIEWDEILAADEYNIRWKPIEDTEWTTIAVNSGPYELTGLDDCTEYEFQIESVCAIDDIEYSESKVFLTRNCGACLDIEYCPVSEAFAAEYIYINKIEINGYVNESGNNSGYKNFDGALAEDIIIGETFNFVFEPGFEGGAFPFGLTGWIDLDGNGNFEESEMVISVPAVTQEISREVLIPMSASPGLTRMRIHYSDETDPCKEGGNFIFGEAEDYCLNLLEMTTSAENPDLEKYSLEVFPNPFQNALILKDRMNSRNSYDVEIINTVGEQIYRDSDYRLGEKINVSERLKAGVYFLIAENKDERMEFKVVKM